MEKFYDFFDSWKYHKSLNQETKKLIQTMIISCKDFLEYFNIDVKDFYTNWFFGGCYLAGFNDTKAFVYCFNIYDTNIDSIILKVSDSNPNKIKDIYSFQINYINGNIKSHRIRKEKGETNYNHILVNGVLEDKWLPDKQELYPNFLYNFKKRIIGINYDNINSYLSDNFFHQLSFSVNEMIKNNEKNIKIINDEEMWDNVNLGNYSDCKVSVKQYVNRRNYGINK